MITADIPFERMFSMPAFEGLRVLRLYMEKQSKLPLSDLLPIVEKVEPDAYALDLDAASALVTLIEPSLPNDGALFYRGCISTVLLKHQPVWLRVLTLGRFRFLQKLARDEYSLFRQAALLDYEFDESVVAWWDTLAGSVRRFGDAERQERSRRAERLSYEKEKKRLKQLGITLKPIWMGLEDNTAGYDILSYDPGNPAPTKRLIEVKSTVASPLRFVLTRNEWDKAKDVGPAYCFHIWNMQPDSPVLYVRSVDNVALHIPADSEKGKWKTVEIPVAI
jgi:Protein NO VEIN, C-terminal